MPSSPLLAVNNNVSLISIQVAPSSWLASVIIVLVFLALYIPRLSLHIPRFALPPSVSGPSLPALPSYRRLTAPNERPLPALPAPPSNGPDRELVLRRHRLSASTTTSTALSASDLTAQSIRDGCRSSRRPRRLLAGLRAPSQPYEHAPLVGAAQRTGHGGSRGIGHRFRRWVLASSVAEPRQRRSESRLLEAPARAIS